MPFRLFALFVLMLAASSAGNTETLSPSLIRAIDANVRQDMRTAGTPGASLAIVRDGRIVYVRGYGVRDLARGTPVDAQTIFRFGSVSKQFSAAALLLLEQNRKLSLEQPLSDWFPHVEKANEIRLVDLLSQITGYRDYYPLDYVDREMSRPVSATSIVSEYGALPLTTNPRTRWEYSNTNYLFAGLVAERVSGMPLGTLFARRFFVPLRMTRTFYDEPYRPMHDRATGYNSYFTEPQHEDAAEAPNWLNAAGSIAGTASDLARWDLALMGHAVLTARSMRAMTTERVLMPGTVHTHYGLGQFVFSANKHRIVEHNGAVIGFASANVMAPDDRTFVVVLTNSYEGRADTIAWDVLGRLVPAIVRVPAKPKIDPRAPAPPPTVAQAHAQHLIERGLDALRGGTMQQNLADPDFAHFLQAGNARRARSVLALLGTPRRVSVAYTGHRGGLALAVADVTFSNGKRRAVLFATPAGKISELFLVF